VVPVGDRGKFQVAGVLGMENISFGSYCCCYGAGSHDLEFVMRTGASGYWRAGGYTAWRGSLPIVKAETVLRWHRRG